MGKSTKISNKVVKDYERLVKEISKLNGLIYHNLALSQNYINTNKSLKNKRQYKLFLGSHFYYRSPYNGTLIPGNFYIVGPNNFVTKTDFVSRKTTNYFVSLGYESFEKFLRSITARIITNNKKKSFDISEKLGFSSYRSCYLYLRSQYRNNLELISLLRKMCPDLDSSFKKEKGLKNFINFYRVYTKCRNHIIHSDDLIKIDVLGKEDKIDLDFGARYFGTKQVKPSLLMIDTTKSYTETLQNIVSLAYLLITSFDSTSIK